jgi:alkylation response protein AidB-like acyl-CoA dehydrogenase
MYRAPLNDIRFALDAVVGAHALDGCTRYAEYSAELAESVLEEAARYAENVLDPLWASGDREGARWSEAGVTTPTGFKAAYQQLVDGGWTTLRAPTEHGGQGLPALLCTAVEEVLAASNLAFRLCPLLTAGAVEAILERGSEAQKARFLPRMIDGRWSGTMNLTEPQAGSDLALVRTRAVRDGEQFRLFGQKIYITYGEHDLTENIIHLVLARVEGAPAGVKGLSLFIVPKFLVGEDGEPGARNDLQCTSIERKLGIHASPTCVMQYGQKDGAIGYLLGEENRGLEYMFIMMNAARLGVGLEGYAVAERAYQRALDWARNRRQGGSPTAPAAGPQPIANHADVKRMLLTMRSQIEACRYLALYGAATLDQAEAHDDPATRARAQTRIDFLIPIIKGWCTETGLDLASIGIQIHGGMGFIEDSGAPQSLRDARIGTIYEGTTGIQAADLIGRKFARDRGAALGVLIAEIRAELEATTTGPAETVRTDVLEAVATLERVATHLLQNLAADPLHAGAVAVPFLKLCGLVLGGWLHARAARVAAAQLAAGSADADGLKGRLQSARFYAEHVLGQTQGLARMIEHGAQSILEADSALF